MALRFEMKAIRSWTRARRRSRVTAPAQSGNGFASRDADGLSAVLDAYDRQFESAAAAERSDAERREQFRLDASSLLDTVIAPALHDLGHEIIDHGHGWDVESRVDILGQPALACTFWPRETKDNGGGSSVLSFRFQFPDRLTVAGSTENAGELQELPSRSYEIENLDPGLVRNEVIRFVSRIIGDG
ncbi:MAG: hypothetical protein ACC682_01930 [Gemmatimonadota bacterium]